MKRFFPTMYDRPSPSIVLGGFTYGFFSFIVLPFLMIMFSVGLEDEQLLIWFDAVLHTINLIATAALFREYLAESFFTARYYPKRFFSVTGVCAGLCILYAFGVNFFASLGAEDVYRYIAQGVLPLAETELFNLPVKLIVLNPVVGMICVGLVVPLTVSCLFYATGFAPMCASRPWLAYILVAVVLAIPRLCNVFTFREPWSELTLYLVQLPVHLLACVAYQKTDTVWAPAAVLMASNAAAGLLVILQLAG